MISQVERVNAAWERIEKWYAINNKKYELPAGATAADITSIETHLGVALPEELKASLMRHNGAQYWTQWELLSAKRLKKEWGVWAKLLDDGVFSECLLAKNKNPAIKHCSFDKLWIPIDANGAGNSYCLDLNPGPNGTVGQIIDLNHDFGQKGPFFPDYAAYLENAADELEDGKYVVDDLYLVDKEEFEEEQEEDN